MKVIRRSADGVIHLCGKDHRSMVELRSSMRENPELYQSGEYSLIEERPWLRIVKETNIKVEEVKQ